MEAAVTYFFSILNGLKAGTADANMLDSIKVKIDGNYLPLNQISYIGVSSQSIIRVQPWEATWINDICKTLNDANLGVVDKNKEAVFLKIPPMTGDRRTLLIGMAKKTAEQQKIVLRNLRRDARSALKDYHPEIDQLSKQYIDEIDSGLKHKIEKLSKI